MRAPSIPDQGTQEPVRYTPRPSMIGYLGLGLVAFLLVLLNGFFVLAEFAIVKVRATRLEELADRGVKNAKAAREIIAQLDTYLSATQLGITLASLGLGWIGEPA